MRHQLSGRQLSRNSSHRHALMRNLCIALLRYEKPRTQIDLKTRYTLSRRLSLFCDVENILAEPLNENYLAYEDRAGQTRLTAPKIVAGLQGRF